MPPNRIRLAEKLAAFDQLWSPKIVAELNGQQFKLAKLKGEFHWHLHQETDECFLVVEGNLEIDFRDGTLSMQPGDFVVIPANVEHCPRSTDGCSVLLIEKAGTRNTGDDQQESHNTTMGEWLT